jgi:hypothetical protein
VAEKVSKVWKLPARWSYPLLAAWRTFEASLNPAFWFSLKCGGCGAGGKDIEMVRSKKKENTYIGIQCQKCKQTLKFEQPVDAHDKSMPERLVPRPKTVLESPQGVKGTDDSGVLEDITTFIFE